MNKCVSFCVCARVCVFLLCKCIFIFCFVFLSLLLIIIFMHTFGWMVIFMLRLNQKLINFSRFCLRFDKDNIYLKSAEEHCAIAILRYQFLERIIREMETMIEANTRT